MEDRQAAYQSGLPRPVRTKMAIALLIAAIIGGTVLFVLSGKPTPTAAGLKQIPPSALTELKSRFGVDGRWHATSSPPGRLTRLLAGAALLGRGGHRLRLEVRTQYYFRLNGRPAKGAPAGWAGEAENYSVALIRTSPGQWQIASVKLIPQPQVHDG